MEDIPPHERTSPTMNTQLCTICGQQYSSKKLFNGHMKRLHKSSVKFNREKQCPLCPTKVFNYNELDKHLTNCHNIRILYEGKLFQSEDGFKKWKQDFEKQEICSYICLNSVIRKDKTKIITYICHRSGNYVPTIKCRQRALKLKGSNKISSICPARMKVKVAYDGRCVVDIVSTHVGHHLEAARLRLTNSERQEIAGKLFQGIPAQRIVQDISSNFDPNKRISYTTNHDIHNVKQSFGVESVTNSAHTHVEKYEHNNDNNHDVHNVEQSFNVEPVTNTAHIHVEKYEHDNDNNHDIHNVEQSFNVESVTNTALILPEKYEQDNDNKPAALLKEVRANAIEKLQVLMNFVSNCEILETITSVSEQLAAIQSGFQENEKVHLNE